MARGDFKVRRQMQFGGAPMWVNHAPGGAQEHGGRHVGRGERFVVQQWDRRVMMRDGAVVETLGPGAYRRWGRGNLGWTVDVRPWILPVPTQEIPTADGVAVKMSVVVQARVVDPVAYVTANQDVHSVVYLRVQVALRDVVARLTIEELLAGRAAGIAEAVGDLADTGVTLDRVEVRDIVLPAQLKKAQAQVLLARAEGQATLERARAETAALRALANAARLAQETPALIELRLLQELGRTSGHTIVVGSRPFL